MCCAKNKLCLRFSIVSLPAALVVVVVVLLLLECSVATLHTAATCSFSLTNTHTQADRQASRADSHMLDAQLENKRVCVCVCVCVCSVVHKPVWNSCTVPCRSINSTLIPQSQKNNKNNNTINGHIWQLAQLSSIHLITSLSRRSLSLFPNNVETALLLYFVIICTFFVLYQCSLGAAQRQRCQPCLCVHVCDGQTKTELKLNGIVNLWMNEFFNDAHCVRQRRRRLVCKS